jgi:hypothetical protein
MNDIILDQKIEAISFERHYKDEFVQFIESLDWHWMVTIGIGSCPKDEELIRRLRIIEAQLCGRYLSNSYHKLADADRYSMMVGFEGERTRGTRHAHILVRVPTPTRRRISHSLAVMRFKWEFWCLWLKLNGNVGVQHSPYSMRSAHLSKFKDGEDQEILKFDRNSLPVKIDRIGPTSDTVNKYYAVKRVNSEDVSWSDVQFVTLPMTKTFENANTKKIHNRSRKALLKRNRYERQLARL